MGGTVVSNLTDISLCEAVDSWTGAPTPTVQDVLIYTAKQGTYCLQNYSASAVVRNARWDFGATSGYWKDFAGKFLYSWFAFSMKAYTTGTGTITIRLTDGAGKNREWDIFNKTTLPHIGWIGWCIHADYGYDRQDSGFNVNQIRYAGWLLADTAKSKVYIYWDAWRFGAGLGIKAGTDVSPAVFEDFYTEESTLAYGVVDKIGGVYFVKGQIAIGSMTINESTYFKDSNQVIIFQDIKGTPSGVYEIKGQRYNGGTGATKIFFGENGIGGSVIKASSAMKFKVTMTDLGVTEFGFHGCIIQNADTISLPVYNANKKMLNCNFISCVEIASSTTTITTCNFISSPAIAVSYSTYLTYCNFIGCAVGIEITASQTVVGLIFTGCTYDVKDTGSAATVTNTFNSNAGSYDPAGSVVTFETSVTITLDGLITGSEIEIVLAGTQTEKAHEETSGTSYAFPYNWVANYYVDIFVTKNDYEWYVIWNYLLPNANSTLPISQRKDRVYSNP